MKTTEFTCKHFNELNSYELYEIGRARQEVFILEQNCPYVDFDSKDFECYHLYTTNRAKEIQCYARLVPIGVSYEAYVSIGRVITTKSSRGIGLGKKLMEEAIALCKYYWPNKEVKISAQTYLLDFYMQLGFCSTGKEYEEDGIPHTEMILTN